jgi:cold shock CspA family protein
MSRNTTSTTTRAFMLAAALSLGVGAVHAEDLKGRIEGIDLTARTFSLNGETVYVTDKTDYENDYKRFEDLREGHYVEVDIKRRDGRLYADDIEFKLSDNKGAPKVNELKGRIQGVDPTAKTFALNGETVYVTDKTDYENDYKRFEDLRVGHYVEVDIQRRDGRLYADDIQFKQGKQ